MGGRQDQRFFAFVKEMCGQKDRPEQSKSSSSGIVELVRPNLVFLEFFYYDCYKVLIWITLSIFDNRIGLVLVEQQSHDCFFVISLANIFFILTGPSSSSKNPDNDCDISKSLNDSNTLNTSSQSTNAIKICFLPASDFSMFVTLF